jgi:UDP-N-acetylglucosamine diphosphorylase / glucose-1-phosphate thymidylyltransferase / UDP-N-acetylgalactosamine diphosphorylase / glucosamine-1-phosphate N-acetyltransferase / galactosamine-1-phosphate N-acetyltransferase
MDQLSPDFFFKLEMFSHKAIFQEIPFVWSALSKIKEYLNSCDLGKIECFIPDYKFIDLIEKVTIGEGTVVEPGAYIRGPCVIGKRCQIRHGAYIRGNVVIGDDVVIGHATEVKNSIFLNKAQAGHFAYLGDSILGNGVNLGAGTKCANLKLDHSEVYVSIEGVKYQTKLKKFGAILGDLSQLGCNSVTNPGTLLGSNSLVYPNVTIGGYFSPKTCIKPIKQNISTSLI